MFDKMKQLMEMRRQADKIKKELESCSVENTDIKGIKVVVNGSQQFQSIEIDPGLLTAENKERLQRDLLKALNNAVKQSQLMAAQKMKDVMPGLSGMGF